MRILSNNDVNVISLYIDLSTYSYSIRVISCSSSNNLSFSSKYHYEGILVKGYEN